jgi:acyl-CoA reductase-like NAD-dependent aldehyde dehydrogenase
MAVIEYSASTVSTESRRIDVLNPVTQQVIGQIPVTTREQVTAAVARARQAQQGWAALTVRQRGAYFRRWLDLLWRRQAEGIRILKQENGKSEASAFLEFCAVDLLGQYYIHHAPAILSPKHRNPIFPLIQYARVYHKPVGVVGVITPWNYPFAMPFMDATAALMAGNAVLIKPSEITPFVVEFGVQLMIEAGFPPDLIQIVHGDGTTGAALVDVVDSIQFTGSTAVGRSVAIRAAERLIPCCVELGGKDPAIVLADADIDLTAVALIQGAFENAGQMCISIERVYVEEAIYDALIERILFHMQRMYISASDGFDVIVGSMTNQRELDRTKAHIADAVARGARVLAGGKERPDIGPLFYEPTVLVDVDHSMEIMLEESFGPLMPIMRVKDVEEALRLANDSRYGLSASIFSRNLRRAEKLATRIDTGDVSINRAQFVTGTPSLPMGGQRESGIGRRNGPEGLLKFTAPQSIMADNQIGMQTELKIATPLAVTFVRLLHWIRRYIWFI